jgi:hypothetical protein
MSAQAPDPKNKDVYKYAPPPSLYLCVYHFKTDFLQSL